MRNLILIILAFQFGVLDASAGIPKFESQLRLSKKLMLKNISRSDTLPGVVVASPSKENPNYFFHWIRDAALTMDTVGKLYKLGHDENLRKFLFDYTALSRLNQITPNLSGGLGEPKFNVDGSAFNDPWGRPQSDGPALRAIALIQFAGILLEEGNENYVRNQLYPIIEADLKYVAENWQNSCFDIWEETRGNHFYTMMVQRRALIEGATLADKLGDHESANLCQQQAGALKNALERFWDRRREIIFESQNQVATKVKSGLDTAVILGILHGYADDGYFSPSNDKVLSTAMKLKNAFDQIYPINQNKDFTTAIGRYAEDTYNGNGDSQGNPWFLTTLAFAELCYRARLEFKNQGIIKVTSLNIAFFKFVSPNSHLKVGIKIRKTDRLFQSLLNTMTVRGDEFVFRALNHAGNDGAMSEEINRNSGEMQGAENLTWSHASFINALLWRSGYTQRLTF